MASLESQNIEAPQETRPFRDHGYDTGVTAYAKPQWVRPGVGSVSGALFRHSERLSPHDLG